LIRVLRVIAVLLVLATGLVLAQVTSSAVHELRRTDQGLAAVERLRLALVAAEMASRERGPTNGLLGDDLPHYLGAQELGKARARTDAAFAALLSDPSLEATDRDTRVPMVQAELTQARANVDRIVAQPLAQRSQDEVGTAVQKMVAVIVRMVPLLNEQASQAQAAFPPIDDDVQAARLIAELREYAGQLGSHFTVALVAGRPFTRAEHEQIQRTRGRIDELRFLVSVRIEGAQESAPVAQAWAQAQQRYFERALKLAEQVIAASDQGGRYGMDPAYFAAAYVPDMNSIFAVRDALLDQARQRAAAARSEAQATLAVVVGAGLLLLAVVLGTIVVVQRRVLKPLTAIANAVNALARNRLDAELPRAVADDEMSAVIGAVESLREHTQQRLVLEQERNALIEQLRIQSNTDSLTGLANRRGFIEAAEHQLANARRHGVDLALVLLDVDHFKRFNDELGHAAGDAVLVEVARAIGREVRGSDLAGRLGGEEFVVLLSHSSQHQAQVFAERLRAAIERIEPPSGTAPEAPRMRITVSLGVASFSTRCATLELLISRADAAMYCAKTTGRNRVVLAD
jgi:diguanylate cyclase (GGDEF)-like protein